MRFVSSDDARDLLGHDYARMMRDPIRNKGPEHIPGSVYPWNVVDYLTTLRSIATTQGTIAAERDKRREELLEGIIEAIRGYYEGHTEYIRSQVCLKWLAEYAALQAEGNDHGM